MFFILVLFGVNALETAEETKDATLSLVITQPGCWERYSEHALEKKAFKRLEYPHVQRLK